jgi:hypothetical protein
MNIENAIVLRDLVAKEEIAFGMELYLDAPDDQPHLTLAELASCGTAACLAGHVAILLYPDATLAMDPEYIEDIGMETIDSDCVEIDGSNIHIFDLACKWLEIDEDDARELFFPWNWPWWAREMRDELGERQAAIALLNHLIQKEQQS